jgi:putative membrane protein
MNASTWTTPAWFGWALLALALVTGQSLFALRGRRRGRFASPWWRAALFALGSALVAGSGAGLSNPLASMTTYTLALMLLGQVIAPLLLLGLPPQTWAYWRQGRARLLVDWMLDPWVAFTVFALLTVGVNLPGIFNTALANALYTAPIGLLSLLAGLLIWAQLLPASTSLRQAWVAGLYGWAASLPMMAIALLWLWSPQVLYTPYLNVLCVWNLSPLADQRYAGLVMLAAGLPMQFRSAWLLLMVGTSQKPS